MRLSSTRLIATAGGLAMAAALTTGAALAQTGPGNQNQGRDCKTVLTCNFARGAEVRGCLSSYTCRTCAFVDSRCRIGNAPGTCRKVRCTWGG
ncbi:MAG TPA: hypothetical protein PK970_02135 [Hyphomicrobiaceae bacterium]|nr:hypothetical protein [Hyphomicrobiaceae bacterium]